MGVDLAVWLPSAAGRSGDEPTPGPLANEAAIREATQQTRAETTQTGRWTHTLIPNLTSWVERSHGQVDFYLTQVISGHGCFRSYLKRFGHETEDWCPVCGSGVVEDARHELFECHRFDHERQKLEAVAGSSILPETLVPLMLADQCVWEAAATFAADVMKSLREQERRRKEQTE
ncbi:uncharacterized protein [Drosophila kikkawai]|uniref:Reverse transcriptase n=1 Tax=Drosophila kikkawai TaxID=30033 RepID=A0ABM4GQG5_DROKI